MRKINIELNNNTLLKYSSENSTDDTRYDRQSAKNEKMKYKLGFQARQVSSFILGLTQPPDLCASSSQPSLSSFIGALIAGAIGYWMFRLQRRRAIRDEYLGIVDGQRAKLEVIDRTNRLAKVTDPFTNEDAF